MHCNRLGLAKRKFRKDMLNEVFASSGEWPVEIGWLDLGCASGVIHFFRVVIEFALCNVQCVARHLLLVFIQSSLQQTSCKTQVPLGPLWKTRRKHMVQFPSILMDPAVVIRHQEMARRPGSYFTIFTPATDSSYPGAALPSPPCADPVGKITQWGQRGRRRAEQRGGTAEYAKCIAPKHFAEGELCN